MISFRNIVKSFGDRVVLDGVSFDVERGQVCFIIGASGAGKSVLIKQVVGLLSPDTGEVWVDGENITGYSEQQFFGVRRKCALVFQHSTLFDSMTCTENVALPLRKHQGLSRSAARGRAVQLLREVGMEEFGDRYPAELGDGMRKRVAIARALTLDPECILFDEPTTSLDPVSARRVDKLIGTLSSQRGITCLVVSHDLGSIFSIAHRIVMLYRGHLLLAGTAQDFRACADPIVQQFITGRSDGPMRL